MSFHWRYLSIVLICCAVCLLVPSSALAAGSEIIPDIFLSPDMVYITQTYTNLDIDTYGQAELHGSILADQDLIDEVWIYLYLERYVNGSWQTFNSWSASFSGNSAILQEYDVVPHGYYYRVRGSYFAWSGSNYEHINGYSATLYY